MNAKGDRGNEGAPGGDGNTDLRRVYTTFVITAALGLVGALLYCVSTSGHWALAVALLGGSVLVAGTFAFLGALIGFVFAIPRSRQDQGVVQQVATVDEGARRLSDYAANTNLEQISDWLTKILVGITLVQFGDMSERFGAAATALSPMLGSNAAARSVALALMTYFMVWGFFFAYLSTRLWLPKALSRAEREEQVQKREVEKEAALRALERQAYDFLYQASPGGYTRAIDAIETHHATPGSLRSAWLWLYLASAYGQRHADETNAGNKTAADATREKAVLAVQEALRLNPGTRPILEQLYRGKDVNENDLATLKPDPRLEAALGP